MLRVLLCSFFLLVVSSSAEPLLIFCANSTNSSSPTDRTVQDSQRKLLLYNLTGAAPSSPFFFVAGNSSSDSAAGPLFFLAQCRPDLSSTECLTCLFTGIEFLTTATPFYAGCPFSPAASIRLDDCLLRYSNSPLLGVTAGDGNNLAFNSIESPTDPAAFKKRAQQLLHGLTADAAQSPARFATGESGGVYGMAWCTLDLPSEFCSACLTSKIGRMPFEKSGAQFLDFRCLLRFESQQFYYASVKSAAAPAQHSSVAPEGFFLAVGSLPPTTVGDNNGNIKRSGRAVPVIGISLATALALI